ncbi:MAG: hypothetical protein Q4Q62_04440 [Thermoplasmata archaeon]|nr:hypothetical protein [Thermoplasmata archaeon]
MEKQECLTRLSDLVGHISAMHYEINEEWKRQCDANGYELRNLNKIQVRDLSSDWTENSAEPYRKFLYSQDLDRFSPHICAGLKIRYRIKMYNSIYSKISKYISGRESGKVAVRKCLNDIFGIRAIVDADLTFEEIREFIEPRHEHIRCHNSSKARENQIYVATHIYIEGEDRRLFPWELQIWLQKDEASNYVSHEAYKQDYTRWEPVLGR